MSTAEIKIDLISRIVNTNEPGIIEELRKLLDFELDKEVYQLTIEQEQRIHEAQAEYLAGQILSEEEANQLIDKWLNGK